MTAGRLFGRRAAFFAAALFAVLGPTLHLGAFATYDALSMLLVAVAAWCVVRAGERRDATGWMVAAGVALALANAAAYSSALFDPVVVVLALLTALPKPGGKLAAGRCVILVTVVAVLLTAGLLIGGSSYLTGVKQTTLTRVGGARVSAVGAAEFLVVDGPGRGPGGVAVVVSWAGRQGQARTWLLVVLAAAALLGPLEHARLHTAASLNKHVDLGAWFAAIAAGYAVDRFIAAAPAGRPRAVTFGACVVALAFPASLGASQSRAFATSWPNAGSFTAILRPLADHGSGHLLVEDPSIAEYYLPAGSTSGSGGPAPATSSCHPGPAPAGPARAAGVTGAGNAGVYAEFIPAAISRYVALNFADTTPWTTASPLTCASSHHYHIVQVVPYGIEVPPVGQGTYVDLAI